MKILITGASGQIGQHLIPLLATTHHEFIAPPRRALDITDAINTQTAITAYKPELIINLAAYTAVDLAESNTDLAFAINSWGTENVARASAAIGAAIIHISTDYVFSGRKSTAYTEEDEPSPINVYGKSKLAGEQAVAKLNPRHLILRTSWVFSRKSKNFFTTMLSLANKKEAISVVDDQIGSPTYAQDVARTIIHLVNQLESFCDYDWGTYHYAGAPYASWFSVADYIFKGLQRSGATLPKIMSISTARYNSVAKRPANSCLATQKITKNFEIMPSHWQARLDDLLRSSPH